MLVMMMGFGMVFVAVGIGRSEGNEPPGGPTPVSGVGFNASMMCALVTFFMLGILGTLLFRIAVPFCQSSLDFLLRLLGISGELPRFNSDV